MRLLSGAGEVVAKFGMGDVKVTSTPFTSGCSLKLGLAEAGVEAALEFHPKMADVPYRSPNGSLMYSAVCTRFDLSMAISALSKLCQDPQPVHWEAAKTVQRYGKELSRDGSCCMGSTVQLLAGALYEVALPSSTMAEYINHPMQGGLYLRILGI